MSEKKTTAPKTVKAPKKGQQTRQTWKPEQWSKFTKLYLENYKEGPQAVADAYGDGMSTTDVHARAHAARAKGVALPKMKRPSPIPVDEMNAMLAKHQAKAAAK